MTQNEYKQLNTFEIKREISRIAKAISKSKILVNAEEFKLLDMQENKNEIVKLLLKEFKRCDDSIMTELKTLLERYSTPEYLQEEMENILTDDNNSNNLKLHAIEVLSHVNTNWNEEDYQQYLEFDEERMIEDTKKFLKNSKYDPEIQLDFLDFLATIADSDKYSLLESMSEEQAEEDLANVLVPVFLSYTDSPIGIFALNKLKSTKSVYAYRSLSEVYDIMPENLQPAIKKCLTELRFSGADRILDKIHDYTSGKFSFLPPDAEGSCCLFYEKVYEIDGEKKSDFLSIVYDDHEGIRECLGVVGGAKFEISVLKENLLDNDKDVEITPEIFKSIIHEAEKLTYKTSSPPYEYNCWKQLFIDIPLKNFDLDEILTAELKVNKYSLSKLVSIFEKDCASYWAYTKDFSDETQTFFNKIENTFSEKDFQDIDLQEIINFGLKFLITDYEKVKWVNRLLFMAYYCLKRHKKNYAQILYSIAKNEDNMSLFFDCLIKRSVFSYFTEMLFDKDFSKFSKINLEKILDFLSTGWEVYE